MENASPDFLHRLEDALARRGVWLEAHRIPLLKDLAGTYRTLFESVVGTLVKKGLLREDPYDYDAKVSAILVPPDTVLPEAEEDTELSRRISLYRRQLELLLAETPFTLASLDLSLLKKISTLFSYVDWEGFGETSHSPTTRAVAHRVSNVGLSRDALSSRVLHESRVQLEKLSRDIRERLAEVEAWQRESWKAALRAKALPRMPAPEARTAEERAALAREMKKAFDAASPGGAWHPHLVQEILGEDHPPGAEERREKLLASLALPQPGAANRTTGPGAAPSSWSPFAASAARGRRSVSAVRSWRRTSGSWTRGSSASSSDSDDGCAGAWEGARTASTRSSIARPRARSS